MHHTCPLPCEVGVGKEFLRIGINKKGIFINRLEAPIVSVCTHCPLAILNAATGNNAILPTKLTLS